MDARECVLRYLAFRMHPYQEYAKPDLNSFLSNTMSELNKCPTHRIDALEMDFRESMHRARQILDRVAFRKFDRLTGRRGPVNKALFETWSNVLQAYDPDCLLKHSAVIKDRIGRMFSEDGEYVRALSAGTGSITSVHTRFERAHSAIQEILK